VRTSHLLAGVVGLVLVSTVGGPTLGQAAVPAGATRVEVDGLQPPDRFRCAIPRLTTPGHPGSPESAAAVGPAAGEGTASDQVGLVVSIPPVVLIRPYGLGFVVTTNTGTFPERADQFWVLDDHRATPADPAMRTEVLAACSAWSHGDGAALTPGP
jgi:hypothetical protein